MKAKYLRITITSSAITSYGETIFKESNLKTKLIIIWDLRSNFWHTLKSNIPITSVIFNRIGVIQHILNFNLYLSDINGKVQMFPAITKVS